MPQKIELKSQQTIVFIGDSITDADRDLPAYRPLGFGYVHFTANMLWARYPQLDLNIINSGVGGNTIRDLKGRWRRDCIEHKPDILSVLIGVNDVWTQYSDAEYLPFAVYLDEYESTYRQLLAKVRQRCDCRLILMEPFMFCDDAENPMLRCLRGYIDVVGKLAEEFDAVVVGLQKRIDELVKQVPAEKFSDDMVHPHVWAHGWISQQWFDAADI